MRTGAYLPWEVEMKLAFFQDHDRVIGPIVRWMIPSAFFVHGLAFLERRFLALICLGGFDRRRWGPVTSFSIRDGVSLVLHPIESGERRRQADENEAEQSQTSGANKPTGH